MTGRESAARKTKWEANVRATYASDDAFPERIAQIRGSGSLRKYAYASVSVCPFRYHPLSGRLTVYDAVRVEPTDGSFAAAAEFARAAAVDGFVSVGGGSVMDTTKAANLYSTYPADILHYVNAPVGAAAPVPGPLRPHLACPTTSGTGSESTGIAVRYQGTDGG